MKLRSFAVLVSLALLGLFLPAAPAHSATTQTGTYYPLATARILDTRSGNGAPTRPLGAASTPPLQVGGRGGVPTTGVSAVVINLTVAGATGSSYLTVYPSGQTRPTSSAINYRK